MNLLAWHWLIQGIRTPGISRRSMEVKCFPVALGFAVESGSPSLSLRKDGSWYSFLKFLEEDHSLVCNFCFALHVLDPWILCSFCTVVVTAIIEGEFRFSSLRFAASLWVDKIDLKQGTEFSPISGCKLDFGLDFLTGLLFLHISVCRFCLH